MTDQSKITDPIAAMSADLSRCLRCGTKFAEHGAVCGREPQWWLVPKILHDEERAVTPIVRDSWIYRDAGTSSVAHTRFFAAQLLAAADVLAANLAAVTPPSEGTKP